LSNAEPERTLRAVSEPTAAPRISVVIPLLNERERVRAALQRLAVPGIERIVVDGGSQDGSSEVARSAGAEQVVASPRGRARQMQAGFEVAGAPVVLFLHVDTQLDPGWDGAVLAALRDPGVAGGAFRLRFESPRLRYRVIEWGARLRCRLGGHPYGDQALFVRREVLRAVGGIAPTPIFEDVDLVRTIRAAGRLVELGLCARTSPRRYEQNGAVAQVSRNLLALAGYLVGLDRERIARWYASRPSRDTDADTEKG
jgi:rSAM/selenodomain-associated transferase 2